MLPPALLALLMLTLITLISFQTTRRFSEDMQWVAHTNDVLANIGQTRTDVLEAETGQRGYLLSHSPADLESLRTARLSLEADQQGLRRLTSDNPVQQRSLDALAPLVAETLDRLQETADLQRRGQGEVALRLERTNRSVGLTDQIRAVTDRMDNEERRLLRLRLARAKASGRLAEELIPAALAVVLALLSLAALIGGQYARERAEAEGELRRSQAELERKVVERTAESELLSDIIAFQRDVVSEELDLDKVMALVARYACALTRAEGAAVATLDGDEIVYRAGFGAEASNVGMRVSIDSPLIAACRQTGAPQLSDDAWADARVDGALCRALGIRSLLLLPLQGNGQVIGVLRAMSLQPKAFGERNRQTLSLIAGLTATAMSRAAAFKATQDALSRLGESEAQFRSVIKAMQEGLLVQDGAGTILLCNAGAEAILGISLEDLVGREADRPEWQFVREDGTAFPRADHPGRRAVQTGLSQPAVVMGLQSAVGTKGGTKGGTKWLLVSAAPLLQVGQTSPHAAVVTFSDITERRDAQQRMADYNSVLEFQKRELEKTNAQMEEVNARLEALATLDGLTSLKNHRAFQERLADEFHRAHRYGTPLSLILLDVDRFKSYNDTYGHPAGDDVLREVARLLSEAVRDCDFVARYGGEEFAVILPQTASEGGAAIAERCRLAIEAAHWDKRPMTASFGVAALTPAMRDGAALVAEADDLLYVAKANGRNQIADGRVPVTPGPRELHLV